LNVAVRHLVGRRRDASSLMTTSLSKMYLQAFCASTPFSLSGAGEQASSFIGRRLAISASARPRCVAHHRRSDGHAVVVAADAALKLPTELERLVDTFASVPDTKLRYQQLLFFAQKLPQMDPALKTDGNRVRGCTSVVHVHVRLDENNCVQIAADSDAQLTKGLVALLVNGLNGCTAEEVLRVDPSFIVASGLSVSLTPSRNNGFINMVAKIKEKVAVLRDEGITSGGNTIMEPNTPLSQNPDAPIPNANSEKVVYSAIVRKLSTLTPTELNVKDTSHLHARHAAMDVLASRGRSMESHFVVRIVSAKFEGMNLVSRHRMVFDILSEEMNQAHALSLEAWTPAEALKKAK
jgi:BolA-like protein 1